RPGLLRRARSPSPQAFPSVTSGAPAGTEGPASTDAARMTAPGVLGRLAARVGIDRPVAHALLGHGWTMVAGPITLLMIATYLSAEEQGYFYTFNSLVALSVFFELGLSYVLMQAAAHESAHLAWTAGGALAGAPAHLSRLAAILRKGVRWYLVAAAA